MRTVTFITSSVSTTLAMVVFGWYWACFGRGSFTGFLALFLCWSLASVFIAWRYLATHDAVTFSDTYFRSLTVSAIIFFGLCLLVAWEWYPLFRDYGVHWHGYYETRLEMFGWAGLLISFLVGTFSAISKKPWSWAKVSLLTVFGWLSAFCADISFFELTRG